MIDTINLIHYFSSLEDYNECYRVIDSLAFKLSNGSKRLHKKGKMKHYVTTAFLEWGILEISLNKNKCRHDYAINLFVKPVVLIRGTNYFNLYLADEDHYDRLEKEFNKFMAFINKNSATPNLLPCLALWNTNRVDYAYDIEDDNIEKYIRWFQHGKIPSGFTSHPYDSSFYLTSKECNINFYDKLRQLRDKKINFEYEAYEETGDYDMCGVSILRLEVQCKTRKLSHIKEDFRLADRTLKSFWNGKIAFTVLKNYVRKIIGKENAFPYDKCNEMLRKKYPRSNQTFLCCSQIIQSLKEHPELTLDDIYAYRPKDAIKYIHKIRSAGISPIPAEVISDGTKTLENPYNTLYDMLSLSEG